MQGSARPVRTYVVVGAEEHSDCTDDQWDVLRTRRTADKRPCPARGEEHIPRARPIVECSVSNHFRLRQQSRQEK
jgi:hypothetical protein